jgi:hypothetical protein
MDFSPGASPMPIGSPANGNATAADALIDAGNIGKRRHLVLGIARHCRGLRHILVELLLFGMSCGPESRQLQRLDRLTLPFGQFEDEGQCTRNPSES